ncbi:SDR family oxidoreductase [Sphingomonas sp.]|uniref:SDR family oxidoreductase n=1 Tax=Sphingomonas sp. TaxID=28214 RepID=UPI0017AE5898|nr:SDR family oxidoreductase [Sphingomonas sp.]MBA4763150.1 SDR family oxidoreductase [Sphingomonas sp.]
MSIASLFEVSGKVALVTGGSSGIGEMIATTLARAGVTVFIAARKPDRLAEALARIAAHGTVEAIPADLADPNGADRLAGELGERTGQLDILVNNAGATWGAPFGEFPASGWDRVMDLNARATFLLSQSLMPLLAKSADEDDWSSVINVSSVASRYTDDTPSAAYGPSKAAVEQLTRVMARWLPNHRIRVNCIAPGWFPSRMNAPIGDDYRAAWLDRTPLKRFGRAEDIGALAIYLASRASSFVNGQVIAIDGGWSA